MTASRALAMSDRRPRLAVGITQAMTLKIDDDRTRFALLIFDAQVLAITLLQLGKQRQRIVIIAETHGFARHQSQGTENGSVTEAFGSATGIERIECFGGRMITGMNGTNGLHPWNSRKRIGNGKPHSATLFYAFP